MRFDDRIATVLAQKALTPGARAVKWRQLVDLLAQRRGGPESPELSEAFLYLRRHRDTLPATARQEIARALTGRRIDPTLLAFFADDHPTVAAPLLATARLERDEWLALLPRMSPTGRALLRHRRDLGPEVAQALLAFGASDLILTGTVGPPPAEAPQETPEPGEAQIRDLVARIEAFRKHRSVAVARSVDTEPPEVVESFRWETGPDGVILWVADAPRGALIGHSIAMIAARGQHGVDGQAAGAFEKRAPFRDARFSVPGNGPAAGDWRISGVPFFDSHRGNFLGYRGSARRPRLDEVAHPRPTAEPGLFGTQLPADSLRQLIHELRTPLNAIVGFAELIDGQYMGPAAAGYRSRAVEIMDQASRLLSAVDDLDTAARIATRRLTLDESSVDAVALLCRLHDAYERVASHRQARLAISITRDLPQAKVEADAAERMFARMLAATIGLAGEGETISASMAMGAFGGGNMLCLSIDRPRAISGFDEVALLDPGYSPDGDWPGAPALGLGFALRLVRNLAEAVGGGLVIGDERFFLYLPPTGEPERSAGEGS